MNSVRNRLSDKKYIVLSVLINAEYPIEEAKTWIQDNGYILRKVHTTNRYHRFRQHTTKYAKNRNHDVIRTVSISPDIDLIIAYPNGVDMLRSAERRYPNPQELHGAGILDTAKAVIFGRSKYAPAQQRIIDKYGNDSISSIKIGRSPLPSLINKALNILTLGNFQSMLKQYGYDRLYHLFCIITLDSGVKILVEKNSGINIKIVSSYNPPNTEYIDATYIPHGLTFKELLDNGKKVLGDKYFPYDSTKSNCQQYIIGLLKGSSILTKQLQDFVYQDTASLFKDYQTALGIVKSITNIGSAIDTIQKGGKNILHL